MANKEHLKVLEKGVNVWNEWRRKGGSTAWASFVPSAVAEADLSGADLSGADFSYANLAGTYLRAAQLMHAVLTDANLAGADLGSADCTAASFVGADLGDTTLVGATFDLAVFNATKVKARTQGIEKLTANQRAGLVYADRDGEPREMLDQHEEIPEHPAPASQITVGTAKRIIGPARDVLIGLSIPNDLSEAHRDLFLELVRSIEALQQDLVGLRDENRRLSEESEELRKKIDDALPLWKKAWETFVLKAAEGAGNSVGRGAVFTAGFIAGMTFSAFSADAPAIPV